MKLKRYLRGLGMPKAKSYRGGKILFSTGQNDAVRYWIYRVIHEAEIKYGKKQRFVFR